MKTAATVCKNNLEERWSSYAGFGLAALLSLIVFAVNWPVVGPTIQSDESCYLANAAAMAGFRNDLASSFHGGYSLLIVPAFLVAGKPAEIWTAIKAINAGLYFIIVLCLWGIAKEIAQNLTMGRRLSAVALVSLYPMWVIMAGYSFSQIAFVPVFLLLFLFFLRSVEGGGTARFALIGILAGFSYWIHPTGLVVVMSVWMSAAYAAWIRRSFREILVLSLTATAMVLAYRYGVMPWLQGRMTISGLPPRLHYPGLARLLSPLWTIEGVKKILAHTGGHLFYLSIGTIGLIWLGILSLYARAFSGRDKHQETFLLKDKAAALFLFLSLSGMLALSVLLFSTFGQHRLDHWMYGRYAESVVAPVLLAGALRTTYRDILWAVPAAAVCAALLSFGLYGYGNTARFNMPAFWQDFFSLRDAGLWAWLVAGCIPIALAGLLPRRATVLLITAVFVFSASLQILWHIAAAHSASARGAAADFIRNRFPPGSCVAFDHAGINSYERHIFWFDFGFILFDFELKRISGDRWYKSCDGPLFTYDTELDSKIPGVYPLAVSSQGGPWVWVKGRPPEMSPYPIKVTDRSVALPSVLVDGWHDIELDRVWSKAEAELVLPVPKNCRPSDCAAAMEFSVFGATVKRPVAVHFSYNDGIGRVEKTVTCLSGAVTETEIPLPGTIVSQKVTVKIPRAVSPKQLHHFGDPRVLGIALRSVKLVTKVNQ
ncbi:MAG TPA: hypothetical protein PKY58_08575 [Syntrophales bacterium]|nr:hypothetical protein [Syntrophales bacterium]HQN77886.1 hypothetical protein [Syntrophales bacterium]HQQ27570.1 hypothetical protein [Syntrophales bacterium]